MYELPMKAFNFEGLDGSIEIYIEEVFGYPDDTSVDGGYDLKGYINIKASCYSVLNGELWFSSGGLYRFKKQLEPCYNLLKGTANFDTYEHDFSFRADFHNNGHVILLGSYKEYASRENELQFEISSDQTQVLQVINDLKIIEKYLGTSMEVKK